MKQITVLLLAGQRPNPGPICEAYKAVPKSLVPIAGLPMIMHPLASLLSNRHVGRIIVITQKPELFNDVLAGVSQRDRIDLYRGAGGISRSIIECIHEYNLQMPLLVTTADNCLLRDEDIDDFITQAQATRADIAVGLADKKALIKDYPDVRRTWIPFSDKSVSGCNLFWLNNPRSLEMIRFWCRYESSPKKLLRLAWAFGPIFFTLYLFRLVSLNDAFEKITAITRVRVEPVLLKNPSVSIDADKVTDVIQIEAVLVNRDNPVPRQGVPGAPIVIFDLDRTITRDGTYTPFLLNYAMKHRPSGLLWTPLILFYMLVYLAGGMDRKSLKTQMFRFLVGSPDSVSLNRACVDYVDRMIDNGVYADALYTIRKWQRQGAHLILATASYDWLANVFAQRLGFNQVVATRSIVRDGRVIPGVEGDNCYGQAKLVAVEEAIGLSSMQGREVWFYTDHHSDIPLLDICDRPVAVNANRMLENWISRQPNGTSVRWQSPPRNTTAKSVTASVGSLCLGFILFVSVLSAAEHEINTDEIPLQVLQAINIENPVLLITEASVESRGDSVVYELEGTVSGNEFEYEIEVSGEGKILSVIQDYELYLVLKNVMNWARA